MKITFNDNFMFGACTSAEQSEGSHKNFKTNWEIYFEQKSNEFFNQINSSITSDTFNKYKEDVKLYKEIGFGSFRTSISWARIFPKKSEVSQDGINFYHSYFDELKKNNIKIILCLSHFDLPDWVYNNKGFENFENTNYFLDFAKLVLDEYGSKIDYLVTFNEPIVPIQAGYLGKEHLPCIVDNKRAIKAAFGTILAHSKVVQYFNNEYKNENNIKIGVIVNISPVLPKDNITFSDEDKKAADDYNLVHNYGMLDAMAKGVISKDLFALLKEYDCLFTPEESDLQIFRQNKIDFVGINYYSPYRVEANTPSEKADKKDDILSACGKQYHWGKAVINKSRGWEIYPEMMDLICKIIKERYDNIPFYISENGIGIEAEERFVENGIIQDDYRIAFIEEHLYWLKISMDKYGSNCFGYHLWSSIDCWSWKNAYKNKYGLIEIDLKTQERKFKKSAYWYKKLIENKGFEQESRENGRRRNMEIISSIPPIRKG